MPLTETEIAAQAATDAAAAAAEKPVTRGELQTLLAAEVTRTTNAALTNHLKRLDLGGQIAKGFEPYKALLPKPKVEGDGGEPIVDAGAGDEAARAAAAAVAAAAAARPQAGARAPDPELEALKAAHAANARKVAGLEGQLTKEREGRAKAERERVEEAGYAALRTELTGKVIPGTEGDVVDLLRMRKRVHITEDGRALLRLGLSQDEPEEGLSLKDGVERHLKTPEVKHFLPAPTAGPQGRKFPPLSPGGTVPRVGAAGQKPTLAEAYQAKFGRSLDEKL